jgi:hypothetical protein
MKRVVKLSGQWYGIPLPDNTIEAFHEMASFAKEGTPVIMCSEYSDLEEIDIFADEIEMVERED